MAHADIILPTEPAQELPTVRTIGLADLRRALAKGIDDFRAMPSHVVFLSIIYPIVGLVLGARDLRRRRGAAALSARRRLRADRPVRRHRPLRAEPPARARARGHLAPCLRRRARALVRRHSGARGAADRDLPGLAGDRAVDLSVAVRLWHAGIAHRLRARRDRHAGRSCADRARQRGRLPVRGRGARDQPGVVPVVARPRRRCGGGHRHVGARRARQSGRYGGMGADRRDRARARLAAVFLRACDRDAGAGPCDLAPLPRPRRAGIRGLGPNTIPGRKDGDRRQTSLSPSAPSPPEDRGRS